MTREELSAAIEKPAGKQGAALEPGLAERILDDVGDEPGNLPLLEFALTLLWEAQTTGWLTHAAYGEIGQVKGALAQYAEQVFAELGPGQQDGTRKILMQLVQPGEGTEDTRRVATRAEVRESNWPLTQVLAGKRLVVTDRDAAGNETVEVAHEALIQNWSRLSAWIAADRAFRTWQEGLRAAMRQWHSSQGDEGALLRGGPLVQAESWLDRRADDLGPAEQDYIQASLSLRTRQAAKREAHRQEELASERRSRRRLATVAGVLALVTVVAVALSLFALEQRRQAMEAYSLSLAANAREALEDIDTGTGLALALAANGIESPPEKARRVLMEAAYAPGARWREDVEELFDGVHGPAACVEISPDGLTSLVGLADGTISLLNLETREENRRMGGHSGKVNDLAFSPDGRTALTGGDDAQVILWDLDSGEEIRRFGGHSGAVRAVDIAPDGRSAVSGGFAGASMTAPGELILWNLETGKETWRLEGHRAGVVAAEFTPDGSAVLASSGDAQIFADSLPSGGEEPGSVLFDLLLWDVERGQASRRFDIGDDDAYRLAISPSGDRALAASYYNNRSVLWDLQTGAKLRTLEGHAEGVSSVAYSPGGTQAVSGSFDDSLILWDLATGQSLARFEARTGNVLDVAVSPDGRKALSSSQGGGLVLWDLVDAGLIQHLAGHGDMVYDVAYTPDGTLALSSSGSASPSAPVQDASIRLWDLAAGEEIHGASLPVNAIFQIAIGPDAQTVLVATDQPSLRVWDLDAWEEVGWLEGHDGPVTGVEFTPDGKRAVSVSVDGTLILWDVPGRQVIRRWAGHGQGLWAVAVSPDGRRALSDSGDSSMVLWDLETGEEIRNYLRDAPADEPGSSGISFLPDGRSAISCEHDGSLIQWDLETGQQIRRLGTHASLRTRVAVAPDGLLAMTSGMDGTIMLWDLERGELIRQSSGHGVIFDLALSPDGTSVLFGSSDRDITQWRVGNPSSDDLAAWIEANRYVRELSCEERATYQIEPLCNP